MTARPTSRPVPRRRPPPVAGALLTLAALASLLAGCSSTKLPAPLPRAADVAERSASQATKLSEAQNWPAAAREWRQAVDRFSLLNDQANQAIALHNLAQAQRELGQEVEARRELERAADLNQALRQTNEWWRNQIALLQIEARQPDPLQARLATLEPLLPRLADPSTQALFLNELGLGQTRRGNLAAAEQTFLRAEKLFQTIRSPAGSAAVQANRAWLKEEQKQSTEAARLWSGALDKFEALADAPGIARALAGQGRSLLAAQTDLPRAEDLLRRATRNFRLLKSPREEVDARHLLIQCLRAQGKEKEAAAQ